MASQTDAAAEISSLCQHYLSAAIGIRCFDGSVDGCMVKRFAISFCPEIMHIIYARHRLRLQNVQDKYSTVNNSFSHH